MRCELRVKGRPPAAGRTPMSDDLREDDGARHPEDGAVERLPAHLEAIFDQLAHDSEGWAQRLPEASSLQDYARAITRGAAGRCGREASSHGLPGAPSRRSSRSWRGPPGAATTRPWPNAATTNDAASSSDNYNCSTKHGIRDALDGGKKRPHGCSFSPRSSISMNWRMRAARVSGFLAVWMRQRKA